MKIAVITGASSGLGREFVQIIGKNTQKVDAIWAIARRTERLKALQQMSIVPIRPLSLDLTDPASYNHLAALIRSEQPTIAMVICAAGFGRLGRAATLSAADNNAMIDLNCKAAVAVTSLCLPYTQKGSQIIEICSTAAFQPMPDLAVYAASKAFLQSYTKTLHHELLTRGIHVTAVCPYWIKDTEFIHKAQKHNAKSYHHFLFANRAHTVAALALNDSHLNLWVSTPGPVCLLHRIAAKFIPHFIMVPLMALLKHVI
ncbi:MAG: SDR family NAD(P)-dependent oxidoreductase [Eubacteriaceae bacterium]|jgi:short-subunit dehydrogenase|nr:SDR family NAD(P)-dependent oxidoreductase [Eubacteriaceae bacterium]MDD4507352.1 SDR family NAD(P)-dependent oxidoreductase [Eubacteriaceae bacterium]